MTLNNKPMYKKILLIDDNTEEQFFFMNALKEAKAPVKFFFANDAKEALHLAKFLIPDIVFIDINLPSDGLKCLDSILSVNDKQPSVVIYSTSANDNACKQAMERGAKAFIEKQRNLQELVSVLKTVIN